MKFLISCKGNNRYANMKLESQADMLGQFSRMRQWRDVNRDEVIIFIALNISMGLVQKPDLSDYWSCHDVLTTPFFSRCMTRNRFEIINSNLHFNDNNNYHRRGHPLFDSLFKIRPVYDIITRRFREVYVPEQHLSLDEGMVPWKGPLSFRMYIPSKPDRFGLKAFSLNEAKSGYTIGYDVYTGSTFVPDPTADEYELMQNQTYQTVMGMLKRCNILEKGYRLYMDSYYISPTLVDDLASLDTVTVGTVRCNRKEMPKALKRKLKTGKVIGRRRGDVLALKWQDKRDVTILSSAHTAEWGVSSTHDRDGNPVIKPTCVIDYNQHMGGTDLADQLVRYYPTYRRKNKWYIKFFFSLVGMAVTNAYILWKKYAPADQQMSHSRFRLSVVEEMVQSASDAPVPLVNTKARRSAGFSLRRMVERHFPAKVKAKSGAKKQNPSRECVVCKERMKKDDQHVLVYLQTHRNSKRVRYPETRIECTKCDVGLCVTPCFEIYHTVKNFADVDPDTWSQ
ncbi:piggyBac transposable element-derived protein 4-like [Ptychodera flava]|uniref:piggyBac transposable element-derived protein 4-like n=1 Tax=Ptychodera flava TaxID=63121 RepID=UPI00396A606D